MTLQERIMEQRRQGGLQLIVRHADGTEHVLYPKDKASKAAWECGAISKGYTIIKR